jgi:MoxR-like ATPase
MPATAPARTTKTAPAATASLRERFAAARADLSAGLIERDEEVDLALTALVARENLLLVGPPGTAKSMLLDALGRFLDGRTFAILLTKFTNPEEVMGPLDVAGLASGRYVRLTDGYLPTADLAFVDEVFKASSAILNTLLRMLNEGVYQQEGAWVKCPLRLTVAASNEWPDPEHAKELSALFDRFVLRKTVRPILSASGRERLYDFDGARGGHAPALSATVSPGEVDLAHAAAKALPFTPEAKDAFVSIVRDLGKEGIVPGDRRQFKAVGVTRAYAWLDGADAVRPEHLEVLASVLWDDPQEQPAKAAKVIAKIANPAGMQVNSLLVEAEGVIAATDPKDLSQAATAAAKLQEVAKKLAAFTGNARAAKAAAYVKEQTKKIRLASIDSF